MLLIITYYIMTCLGHISQLFYYIFQKTATAVAHCKRGNGLIKVNGRPLDLIEPAMLRYKVCLSTFMLKEMLMFWKWSITR